MAQPDIREGVVAANELTFHIDRGKWLLRLFGCAAFVVVGYLIREESLYGWLGMAFFGVVIPVYLRALLVPHSMALHLDSEGFEIGSLVRTKRIRWADVQCFELDRSGVLPFGGTQVIRVVNAQHIHAIENTIDNSYDAPLIDIMHILNEWRKRCGSSNPGRASSS
ncbi:hypothetical protein [Taklimakanibacter deserti]|uniref:hypothetical protein n=1 Tax=Taklimakanibacter deserti TaxID=2267839 RepID=UPI000E653BDC